MKLKYVVTAIAISSVSAISYSQELSEQVRRNIEVANSLTRQTPEYHEGYLGQQLIEREQRRRDNQLRLHQAEFEQKLAEQRLNEAQRNFDNEVKVQTVKALNRIARPRH